MKWLGSLTAVSLKATEVNNYKTNTINRVIAKLNTQMGDITSYHLMLLTLSPIQLTGMIQIGCIISPVLSKGWHIAWEYLFAGVVTGMTIQR